MAAPKLWNDLLKDICNISTISVFGTALKPHFVKIQCLISSFIMMYNFTNLDNNYCMLIIIIFLYILIDIVTIALYEYIID